MAGFPHLLLHSSSCGLKRHVSQMPKGTQSGEHSARAESMAWKANLLNRKIFQKINRFDYMKSKTCTWQNHTNQTKGQTGNHIYSFYGRQNINNHLNKAFTNQSSKDEHLNRKVNKGYNNSQNNKYRKSSVAIFDD